MAIDIYDEGYTTYKYQLDHYDRTGQWLSEREISEMRTAKYRGFNDPVDPYPYKMKYDYAVGTSTIASNSITWNNTNSGTINFDSSVVPEDVPDPEPRELTDREWLDAQVDEVCAMAGI